MFRFSLKKMKLATKRPTLMSITTMMTLKSQRMLGSIVTSMPV